MISLTIWHSIESSSAWNKPRYCGQELKEYQALSPLGRWFQRMLFRFL